MTKPSAAPSLDVLLERLREVGATVATPETKVGDLDVDSLDLVEWLYAIEDEFGFVIEEEMLEDLEGSTLAQLYRTIVLQEETTTG